MDLAFGTFTALELFERLGAAALLGMLLGLDRELRGFAAGVRTHGILALSAALVVISGLMLHAETRNAGGEADPLRVVQGLFQGVGFIGAGLVFTRHRDVHNLTSAASIILALSMGIAAGAGQWMLAGIATAIGLIMLTVVRVVEGWLPGSGKRGED